MLSEDFFEFGADLFDGRFGGRGTRVKDESPTGLGTADFVADGFAHAAAKAIADDGIAQAARRSEAGFCTWEARVIECDDGEIGTSRACARGVNFVERGSFE